MLNYFKKLDKEDKYRIREKVIKLTIPTLFMFSCLMIARAMRPKFPDQLTNNFLGNYSFIIYVNIGIIIFIAFYEEIVRHNVKKENKKKYEFHSLN